MHAVRIAAALTLALALVAIWPGAPTPRGHAAAAGASAASAETDVLVVGDSLAVGTEPYLEQLLEGRQLVARARSGITTPQGMELLRRALAHLTPRAVVVSLGSNDGGDPHRFADRLRRTLALVPADECVVWATIIRPKRKGPYRGLNRVLHQAKRRDPRLVIVDWEHAVLNGAVYLPDGLHADADGYRHRGAMIADAVRNRCPR